VLGGFTVSVRRHPVVLLLVLALALVAAGCGGDEESATPTTTTSNETQRPEGEEGLRVAAQRAQIVAQESDFGQVLFDANGQVVYVFEIDDGDQSNCTSAACVEAWPPVLTEGEPSAGTGIDAELLGTISRDDGTQQVTYNGRPLYFYEHEGPGEIKCHNVSLHGGLWWVVTPEGEPVA
jgi:predicted lipoprotein with Yx(FWY)xxD motif